MGKIAGKGLGTVAHPFKYRWGTSQSGKERDGSRKIAPKSQKKVIESATSAPCCPGPSAAFTSCAVEEQARGQADEQCQAQRSAQHDIACSPRLLRRFAVTLRLRSSSRTAARALSSSVCPVICCARVKGPSSWDHVLSLLLLSTLDNILMFVLHHQVTFPQLVTCAVQTERESGGMQSHPMRDDTIAPSPHANARVAVWERHGGMKRGSCA